MDELFERLATNAHDAWAGWWRYMYSKSLPTADDGSIEIPAELVGRWWRQAETPYADLPKADKESDREQAETILEIVGQRVTDLELITSGLQAENIVLREQVAEEREIRDGIERGVINVAAENVKLGERYDKAWEQIRALSAALQATRDERDQLARDLDGAEEELGIVTTENAKLRAGEGGAWKLSFADIVNVLNAEILWCEKNPDKAFHREYRKGFINGLIQAKYLIEALFHDDDAGAVPPAPQTGCHQ